MMLSDKHLKELAKEHGIIEPFIEKNCEGATINLTLHSQVKKYIKKDDLILGNPITDDDVEKIDIGEVDFYLEPNSSVLVQAVEKFNIPNNMSALILEKYSVKLLGLVVSPASYMNPGYRGRLSFLMTNNSSSRIRLMPGIKFCQLGIHELSSSADKPYSLQDKLYMDGKDVHISKFHLDNDIQEYLKENGMKEVSAETARNMGIHFMNRMDENAKQYAEIIRSKLGAVNEPTT